MGDPSICDPESTAVQLHLRTLQSIIQRIAGNGASAKSWCATLVSAIVGLALHNGERQYVLISIIPVVLFLYLDCYYLAIEKCFRHSYNEFVNKLHRGELQQHDLFAFHGKFAWTHFLAAVRSPSVWIFYSGVILLIGIIYIVHFSWGLPRCTLA